MIFDNHVNTPYKTTNMLGEIMYRKMLRERLLTIEDEGNY